MSKKREKRKLDALAARAASWVQESAPEVERRQESVILPYIIRFWDARNEYTVENGGDCQLTRLGDRLDGRVVRSFGMCFATDRRRDERDQVAGVELWVAYDGELELAVVFEFAPLVMGQGENIWNVVELGGGAFELHYFGTVEGRRRPVHCLYDPAARLMRVVSRR
jgi:hypothetical protein